MAGEIAVRGALARRMGDVWGLDGRGRMRKDGEGGMCGNGGGGREGRESPKESQADVDE